MFCSRDLSLNVQFPDELDSVYGYTLRGVKTPQFEAGVEGTRAPEAERHPALREGVAVLQSEEGQTAMWPRPEKPWVRAGGRRARRERERVRRCILCVCVRVCAPGEVLDNGV